MVSRLLAFVLAAAWSCSLAASTDARYSLKTYSLELAGGVEQVDVYRPVTQEVGVAVLAHGFARSRVRHRDLARALASAGVVAVGRRGLALVLRSGAHLRPRR